MSLEARQTLHKARFFVQKAKETSLDHRQDHVAFLEAAIIFSRSVTFHLQKELSKRPGFTSWYESWQSKLRETLESRYLLEQRNLSLKEGQIETQRVVSATISSTIHLHSTVSVKVIRGKPWYQRSPRILIEDLLRPCKERLRLCVKRCQQRIAARTAEKKESVAGEKTVSSDVLYFADQEWAAIPAIGVIEKNLDTLEQLVSEAEVAVDGKRSHAV